MLTASGARQGMFPGNEGAQALVKYMSINLRRRNIGMSQHLLHRSKISAMRQQMTCERVPQHMRTDPARFDAALRGQRFQILREPLTRQVAIPAA